MNNASIAIVGGGIIGCLTAYFLRELGHEGAISVLEPDPSYRFSSTALSAASIRTQFGCAVNVELSLFGATFLKNVRRHLGQDAEIGFVEGGYLILGDAATMPARRAALSMQRSLGANVLELDAAGLASRFPWLDRDGVAMATLGLRDEGWFDAWALLQAARAAAQARHVAFLPVRVDGCAMRQGRVGGVRTGDDVITADRVVLAAGAASGRLAERFGVALPIGPRKRTVFHFKAPLDPIGKPMLFDVSGAWMRPEGEGFIGGIAPDEADDPDAGEDFEPDHALFEERLWPLLAERVPCLEQLRLLRAWAGHYEMNLFDHNGVVGPHPDMPELLFATGFSGHGVMHAPGVARGVAEQIVFGEYRSIDLSPLGYGRIARGEPMPESAIY